MADAVRCFAPAKINLALHVTGHRADGYHDLDTLVAFTAAGDDVEAQLAGETSLQVDGPYAEAAGSGPDNLVLKAEAALREAAGGRLPPAAIRLHKRLPVGGGIGGGSADAAATLLALHRLWDLPPSFDLDAVALQLGADVPMCLRSSPLRAQGRGERIALLAGLPPFPVLLVNPGIVAPTPAVFRALRKRDNPPIGWNGDAFPPVETLFALRNDLQEPAVSLFPGIGEALALLGETKGCLFSRMSGSGSTCFAIYREPAEAQAAARAIAAAQPGWWCEATHFIAAREGSAALQL